jgi:hypothetical protein
VHMYVYVPAYVRKTGGGSLCNLSTTSPDLPDLSDLSGAPKSRLRIKI